MTALQIIEKLDLKIWVETYGDMHYAMVLNSEFKSIYHTPKVFGSYKARSLAYDWIEDTYEKWREHWKSVSLPDELSGAARQMGFSEFAISKER